MSFERMSGTMKEKIFDISFQNNGRQYNGWVNPSDKIDEDGKPLSFHVVLDNVSFGYLSFNNCKWSINEERPSSLVEAVGQEIEKHYQL
jgi:hypothetical protein